MENPRYDLLSEDERADIDRQLERMTFTKNFRSPSAEEWYVFLPDFQDPRTGGAAGKVIVHYDLLGNKDVFVNTTIILDDPKLHKQELHHLVYAIGDELVNRLVGYAAALLSMHAGDNSYDAKYN
ncbi:hypothetical protein [Bacillus sp. P14.5]|uniref:hypothetical protein n=1 Tax=Bacillus sp. P14.5 TaxID=1983400 RepID=UPI000DE8923F|nr:hypothetical protein [Bacillus sp. P14.5]